MAFYHSVAFEESSFSDMIWVLGEMSASLLLLVVRKSHLCD